MDLPASVLAARFHDHDNRLVRQIQKDVGKNYDFLADNASVPIALSYLARVNGPAINNTAMAKIIGGDGGPALINAYTSGGPDGTPWTIDPDGVTFRVGAAGTNWQRHLDTDTRPKYVLPVALPT